MIGFLLFVCACGVALMGVSSAAVWFHAAKNDPAGNYNWPLLAGPAIVLVALFMALAAGKL